MRASMKESMPTNRFVYAGYIIIGLPTLYWLSWLFALIGVEFFLEAFQSIPRIALLIIAVILPALGFIIGAVTYLVHPKEKRKLAYQSLIAVSMVYILLIIIQLIDGDLM